VTGTRKGVTIVLRSIVFITLLLIYTNENGKLQIDLIPQRASIKDLIVFTKQFSTMLQSGVPLIQALDILSKQQRIRSFAKTLDRILEELNQQNLSEQAKGKHHIYT